MFPHGQPSHMFLKTKPYIHAKTIKVQMNFSFGEHLLHEREIAEQLQARQSSQLHKYSRFHHKRESKQTHARTTIQGHTGPTTHGATQYTPRARYRKALACTHHTTRVITVQERHSRRLNSLLPPSKCTVRTKDAGSSYALLASKAWNTSVRVTIPITCCCSFTTGIL